MADTYKLPAADYGAGPGEFVRGFRSNLLSNKVGGQASDWFKAKQAGDVAGMLAAEAEIERLRQEQAKVAPTVTDVRQVHGLGDLAKWGAGTVGSALASSGLPALGGLAGGLVGAATPIPGGAAIGSSLGASAGSYNMEANEAAANAFMDEKIRAESEPDKVIKAMRLKGAANAALEGLMAPTAVLGSRVFGNTAKEAIRPGLVGGIQHAGRSALTTGIDEAATEAAQEQVGQYAHSYLNPERDKTGDAWQTLNAAAQGLIGGVAIGAPGTLAEIHRAQKPRDTDEATLTEPVAPLPGLTDAQLLAWDDKRQQDRHDAAYRLSNQIIKDNSVFDGSFTADIVRGLKGEELQGRERDPLLQAAMDFKENRDPEAFAAALQQHVGARHELEDVDLFTRQATGPKSKNSETGEDATHDPEDLLAMRNLFANLAPNSALANDPERATEVYYALKNMMVNDPTADVPLERIAKSFGGEQFLHKALSGMRGDLVRMGELQHDETAAETMKAVIGRRVTSAKQATEVFGRYLTLKAKDTLEQKHGPITQRAAGVTAAELAHRLNNYGQLSQRERDEFEKTTSFLFGSNKETAITSMGGRKHYKGKSKFDIQREEARMDTAREETDAAFDEGDHESQSIFDVEGSKTRFVGRTGAEDGQFFNTHYNKPNVREQARSKMAGITATSRALGHTVEELTPGQYVRASGTPARTVAAQLGVETEGRSTAKIMADLDNHAARILKVTEGVLDEDSVKLSTEDILKLAAKEKEAQRRFGTKVVDAPTAAAIQAALDMRYDNEATGTKGNYRAAMEKLRGLKVPNATAVTTNAKTGQKIVKLNLSHGGEGRFLVRMKTPATEEMDAESAEAISNSLGVKSPAARHDALAKLGRKDAKGRTVDIGKYRFATKVEGNVVTYHPHHQLAAQDVINDSYARLGSEPKQARQANHTATIGRQFAMSMSSILSNEDVDNIHVLDSFGKMVTPDSVAGQVVPLKDGVSEYIYDTDLKEGRKTTDAEHAARVKEFRKKYDKSGRYIRDLTDEEFAAKIKKNHEARVMQARREFGRFGKYFKLGVKDGKPIITAQVVRAMAPRHSDTVSGNFQKMLELLATSDDGGVVMGEPKNVASRKVEPLKKEDLAGLSRGLKKKLLVAEKADLARGPKIQRSVASSKLALDETERREMFNHLMDIVSNEAEESALIEAMGSLTEEQEEQLAQLRRRNNSRNKQKKLTDEEAELLEELEDAAMLDFDPTIADDGRTPDNSTTRDQTEEETGVRKFNELTGDKVGSALKGSRKVEAAPEGVLTLNLKNEVTQEDVPKVLNLLTKAVRDTALLLPPSRLTAFQGIYNLLGRAIDQKQIGTEAVQRSLRKNVKEQVLDILRDETGFLNRDIKKAHEQGEPKLVADGMRYRAAIIALAEKINKLIPAVEADTKGADRGEFIYDNQGDFYDHNHKHDPEKLAADYGPKTLNVYWGSGENKTLSNLAPRPFTYEGRKYRSVEHAYQSLKSGKFDADAYVRGKTMAKAAGRLGTARPTNMVLMKNLIKASFLANPDAAKVLLATGAAQITHTQDTGVWRTAFPKLLMEVRGELGETKSQNADADVAMAVIREGEAATTYEQALAALNRLNKLIAANDGTVAQMKRLNTKQGELAAKVASLKPGAAPEPVTQSMRDKAAALRAQYTKSKNNEVDEVVAALSGKNDVAEAAIEANKASQERVAGFEKAVDDAVAGMTQPKDKVTRKKDPLFDAAKSFEKGVEQLKDAFTVMAYALTTAEHFDPEVRDLLIKSLREAYKSLSDVLPQLAKYVQQLIRDYQAAAKSGAPRTVIEIAKAEKERIWKKAGWNPANEGLSKRLQRHVAKFDGLFSSGFEGIPDHMFGTTKVTSVMTMATSDSGGKILMLYYVPTHYYTQLKRAYLRENGLVMSKMSDRQLKAFDKAFREHLSENWWDVDNVALQHANYHVNSKGFGTDGPSRENPFESSDNSKGTRAYREYTASGKVIDNTSDTVTGTKYSEVQDVTQGQLTNMFGELGARAKAILGLKTGELEVKYWRDTGPRASNEEITKVKLNEVEAPGEGPMQREEVTLEDMDAVRAYIKKTLGPKVKVAFDAALKSTGNWNKTGNDTLISIAMRAANPMSTARHEAMHEFFDRLSDADPAMAAVLAKAANSAPVVRQLEQIFNSMPKVLKALKTDEHERVAYMFEAWSAGLLTVGPATENVFQRIVKMLKAVFGVLNEDAQAERIMELFHEGSLRKPSAIAEVLANDPEMQAAYSTKVLTALDPVIRYAKYLLGTAHGQTASSENPFVSWAGKEMYVGTGEKTNNLGLFAERAQKTNQMQDEVNLIFKDLDDKDMKILVDGLQSRKFSADPKILRAQKRVDRFLQKMLDYANREDPVYGWKGLDIKKAKDYFPRAWDSETIGNNRDQFVADLLKHHGDILERIAGGGHQTYEAGKLKVVKTTPEEVAERIAQVLIYGRGATPNEENLWELGYAPFMAARNARSLDWLDQKHFSQYMQKDAVNILTTYVNQMVHTVEYSKRFGLNGEKLQTALNDAAYWELENHPDKKVVKAFAEARKELDGKWVIAQAKAVENAQKGGAYFVPVPKPKLDDYIDAADKLIGGNTVAKFLNVKIGLTRKQIMAMEGTLGFDISERMRKIQGNLIVYENLRTLPMALFSNLIDPLGVMVHGGSLDDALNTFRLGLEGVINGWRGKDSDNPAYAIARKYGTIDATKMLNSMGQVYSSVWTDRTARRINDALFRANGVEGNAQGNRAGATVAAVHKIETSLTSKSPHDLRLMKELYGEEYKPADVVLTAEGELDPVDRRNQKAVFKLVDRMMLRPNAAMRPGWASDPHFGIFFHLKQFMFAFQKVMLEHTYKEAKHGNYDPLLVMAVGYVPLMIAADMLKDIAMYGGEPPWKKKWKAGDYLQNGVERAGLLGVPQMALDVKKWGPAELGGPAVEQVANAAKTYEKALKKDRRLDVKAAKTHKASDLQKAEDFSGVADATRKTVRAALPLNQLFKRHLYDKYEPKAEKVVKEHLKTGSLQE